MKRLAGGLLVSLACWAPLGAQEPDRSLERIGLALQQTHEIVGGSSVVESALPKSFGVFTLVAPTGPGELVRVSIPIGEFVSRAFKSVAAANHRRQEAAARREVEAALERLRVPKSWSNRSDQLPGQPAAGRPPKPMM